MDRMTLRLIEKGPQKPQTKMYYLIGGLEAMKSRGAQVEIVHLPPFQSATDVYIRLHPSYSQT